MSAHVLVIGGGITGLSAAYTLTSSGRARSLDIRCTLVESDPRLGGKLLTERIEGCLIEAGPDAFLAAKPEAADLCRALGLGDRLVATLPGRAVFIASGRGLVPLPEGVMLGVPARLLPIVRTSLLSPLEKLRVGYDLVLPPRRLDGDISVGAFLRRRMGNAVVERLAGPLLAGIYAGDADALSLKATFPQLLEWERSHGSLIRGAVARRESAAVGDGAGPMFLSLKGGMGELVDALRAALAKAPGVTITTGAKVQRLTRWFEHGRTTYVADVGGRAIAADAAVLAAPAFASAVLLEPLAPALAEALERIPYASTAAVSMGFRREMVNNPLEGHGFVVARGAPLHITACTWMSSKWPHRAPAGLVLLRCYLGAAGRDAVVDEDDARLVETARADLRSTLGIDAAPVFAHVTRWRRAMPQYLPGHLDRLAVIEAELGALPGIALAGAGYRGVGIPDCIRQGTDAATRIIDTLATRQSSTRNASAT